MPSSASSSSNNTSSSLLLAAASFAAGATVALVVKSVLSLRKRRMGMTAADCSNQDRINAGAVVEGQDLSLFYGDRTQLTTVTPSRKFLPKDLYGRMVRDAVVCCVDILLVRRNNRNNADGVGNVGQRQALVVERSSKPVKGVWWLPGGRLLKGETFFDAARRKAREETGIPTNHVTCIQVLGVWNTFFPTSHWDDATSQGTQTVNPIVLVEINSSGDSNDNNVNVKLDETSENYRWISLDPDENKTEDPYVLQALLRLQHWNPNYAKG